MEYNMYALKPEVGQWYRHLDKGEVFLVVGVDEDAGTIEMQSFGGDVDEVELDSWDAMPLARAEQPEDWTGPVDDVERDDLGYADAEAVLPNLTQPPEPLGIEAWDDTRNGAIDLVVEEEERAPAELVAPELGSQKPPR
jgi:hypothetical protein